MIAFAALLQWASIDAHHSLNLERDLVLEQPNGAPALTLKKGMQVTAVNQAPLDAILVQYYKMKLSPCSATMKKQTSEMTIVNDMYGIQLAEDCELSIYVEFRDLYTESPFSERTQN
jgi:hypothetical protein